MKERFNMLQYIPFAERIIKTLFGNKEKREQATHDEQMAVLNQFAAEFQNRNNRTWWDSFIDGLNRLPRPFITFGVIGMFVWAVKDPDGFALSMIALEAVPDMLWTLFLTVVSFWFGTKILEKGAAKRIGKQDIERLKTISDQVTKKKSPEKPEPKQGIEYKELVKKRYKPDYNE